MAAPRIVLFSGGSACRSLSIALSRRDARVTRVVPVWDSGGSSRVIREALHLMPVGDLRQALMTFAYGEGRSDDLVRLCNLRLSDRNAAAARREFHMLAGGAHPLLDGIPVDQRVEIMAGLRRFADAVGEEFDCLNGSIGNFVLAGLMLAEGGDPDGAITAFRRLTGIRDHVFPAAPAHDLQLTATLRDGLVIHGQHNITSLDRVLGASGIARVALSGAAPPRLHAGVARAIAEADVIAFGPGSFFTSILPHLMVDGVVAAISANRRAAKLLLANLVECNETRGRTVADLTEAFVAAAGGRARDVIGTVVVDRQPFPAGKTTSGNAYLGHGSLEAVARALGLAVRIADLEDVWARGRHDGAALARALLG